jgi:23S rRNA pseudouridine2604 synthase
MQSGVDIGDYVTKPCTVDVLGAATFRITISEGKNRQIRRMVSALYNTVVDLKRTRVLNIHLGTLPEGAFRMIKGEELRMFLKILGIER